MGIFLEYLKVSLWMTPVILLALWLLPKLSRRYTPKLAYFVWLLLAVRLLLPWNLTLPAETAPIHLDLPQETMVQWVPVEFSGNGTDAAVKGDTTPVVLAETEKTSVEEPSITPMEVLLAIWVAVGVVSMLRTAAATLQMRRLLKRWEKEPTAETAAFYTQIAGEKRPPLAICPALETPMAVGFFRTKIYLPHEGYSSQEMEMIFRHELIHWRRKDLWYKFVLLLARSIHWFNPLVWFLVKRANKDLEISCDGEAVQGKDAAYRKAYSLMILQEAERSLQRQAALTTCFTDGKKALQERLAEILNREKRKRGMALVAMTLVLALTCGCLVSFGGSDPISENTDIALEEATNEIAEIWAEAFMKRDGKPRYDTMNKECKMAFIEEQKEALGEEWNYVIGWSNPWVYECSIDVHEEKAFITYYLTDSSQQKYTLKEFLRVGEENGKLVVVDHFLSELYWEDGKIHPNIVKTGESLDEGIWDFMYQSVVGFVEQSVYSSYEMSEYGFDILHISREPLENGRDRVIVDFALQTIGAAGTFGDPDLHPELKEAKEADSARYEILIDKYFEKRVSNHFLRFSCEVVPGAEEITEDTCIPETFMIHSGDGSIPFDSGESRPAYEEFYNPPMPDDGWYCTFSIMSDGETINAGRKLLIQDTSGRTDNGYFMLNTEYGWGNLSVTEDTIVMIGDPENEQHQISAEEWKMMIREEMIPEKKQRIYTVWFEDIGTHEYTIKQVKEGIWLPAENNAIPSGYPTDSKTVSAPFSMTDPKIKHLGMDFSSNGKNIPVSATADGIVMVAEFAPDKGYYVKINHMNGFTTLYAHLSELDVKVGDKVSKGDVLGLTGATGMATGIHCHYEIQLNGIYQDPAKYL